MTRIQKFENEYKVDPFKLVEDVNLKYINIVKKIGLQSLIATYVEDNFSYKPTEDFYILLIECFLESKERFPQGQKIELDTPYIISNIPLNPSIPKDKGELESFKDIVAEDTLRPALTGVFVDEKGFLVGTDAFKLVKYQSNKYNKYPNKIINLSTYLKSKGKLIEYIDEKYPDYEVILPKKSSYVLENQNLYAWYNYAKSISAIKKYISNVVVNCQIKMPDNEIYTLSPIILSEVLEFFISKGYKKCTIEYENIRKAILFVFDGSKGLLMPMISDELNGASPISLDEINTIFSEQGSILPRKKITTPKTQKEEEEPNITYKKFEGKLSDTTYIPRRDISYVMLKNGDKLYSSDIIDGVYKLNTKMADGGMMGNGRISAYPNDDYENILGNFDSLETAKKFAKLNKWKYETLTFEDSKGDTIVVSKEDSFKDIDFLFSFGMAEGGMMADGGLMAKGGENDIGYSIILKPIVVENSARFEFNINKRGDGNNIFGYVDVRKVNDWSSERDYYQFKNVEGFEWVYFMEKSDEDYKKDKRSEEQKNIEKEIKKLVEKEISKNISEHKIARSGMMADGGMMAKGGVTKKDEIVYIEYLNKDKKYTKDKKVFKGQHALKDAIAWGKQNLSNFNIDMVKYVMADGGQMEDDVDLFEDYENIPENVQSVLDKYAEVFEEGDYDGLKKVLSELEMIGYTFEYGLDGQAYNLRKL